MIDQTLTHVQAQHLLDQGLAERTENGGLRTIGGLYYANRMTGGYHLAHRLQVAAPAEDREADLPPTVQAIDRQTRLIVATVLFVALGAVAFVTSPLWVPMVLMMLLSVYVDSGLLATVATAIDGLPTATLRTPRRNSIRILM